MNAINELINAIKKNIIEFIVIIVIYSYVLKFLTLRK